VESTYGKSSSIKKIITIPTQVVLIFIGPFPTYIDVYSEKVAKFTRAMYIPDYFVKSFLMFFIIIGILYTKPNLFINIFVSSYLLALIWAGFVLLYRFYIPILPFMIYYALKGIEYVTMRKKILKTFPLYFILVFSVYLFFNIIKAINFNLI
jgi:hypothetical protein